MDGSRADALGSNAEQGVDAPVRSVSQHVERYDEHTREELMALLALSGMELEYIDEVALLRVTGHNCDPSSALLKSLLRKTFTNNES